WGRGTPLLPVVESGLEGLGAEAVDRVADRELRLAEELAVGLGGQEAGEPLGLVQERLLHQLEEALGLGLLLGGQGGVGHEGTPGRGEFPGDASAPSDLGNFPPPFETLTRDDDSSLFPCERAAGSIRSATWVSHC